MYKLRISRLHIIGDLDNSFLKKKKKLKHIPYLNTNSHILIYAKECQIEYMNAI